MKKALSLLLGLTIVACPPLKASSTSRAVMSLLTGSALVSALVFKCYHSLVLKDRKVIREIKQNLQQKNAMQSNGRAIIELYNWNNENYPTARAFKAAEQVCVDALVADAMSGKLVDVNRDRYQNANGLMINGPLHWQVAFDLEKKLDNEIDQLNSNLDELLPHIYHPGYAIKEYLGFAGNSLIIDYRAELQRACAACHANVNDPATWTIGQDQAIEAHMITAAQTSTMHRVRGYTNYGRAAKVYWDVFKKRSRLIAIRQALVKDIRFINARAQHAQQHHPQAVININNR